MKNNISNQPASKLLEFIHYEKACRKSFHSLFSTTQLWKQIKSFHGSDSRARFCLLFQRAIQNSTCKQPASRKPREYFYFYAQCRSRNRRLAFTPRHKCFSSHPASISLRSDRVIEWIVVQLFSSTHACYFFFVFVVEGWSWVGIDGVRCCWTKLLLINDFQSNKPTNKKLRG